MNDDGSDLGTPASRTIVIRRLAAGLLIALTAVAVTAALPALWARSAALDTDRFMTTTGALGHNRNVTDAVADALSEQAVAALADNPDLAEWVREPVRETLTRVLASEAFRWVWDKTLRTVHQQVAEQLRADGPGEVILSLRPVLDAALDEVARRLPLAGEIHHRLPADAGRMVVLDQRAAEDARRAVRWIDGVTLAITAAAPLLAGGALVLSPRRRRASAYLGVAVAGAGGLVAAAPYVVAARLVAAAPPGQYRAAVQDAVGLYAGGLRSWAGVVVAAGLLLAVGSLSVGRLARLLRARRDDVSTEC